MNRFTKILLIAAVALGFFAMFSVDSAEAGWGHGGGCYRSSDSTSYNNGSSFYRPSYSYGNAYAPSVCRTSYSGGYGGYGGFSGYGYLADGAVYDPALSVWSVMASVNAPEARGYHTGVYIDDADALVIWGGARAGVALNTGAQYDLGDETWTALPTALSARRYHTAVSTGSSMIIWGGSDGAALGDGALFTP